VKVLGIVPARLAASRFPGKPLAPLRGMPMIGHCYHRTRLALGSAYVATCDDAIADYVRQIGGRAVLTADSHRRATTRTAEAVHHIEQDSGERAEIVVMVQGDEPLVRPEAIASVLPPFADPTVDVVNLMSPIWTYEEFADRNNVKVVVDRHGDALYFSREPIPSSWQGVAGLPMFMQTGVIAFRRAALVGFNAAEETPLERIEGVDMNRVLETGGRVRMVLGAARTVGVDTAEELAFAETLLASDPAVDAYLHS
jgi:3-deoxy-manno-octulosonate cytidylyltransferase (CMP-KDO synthetase)